MELRTHLACLPHAGHQCRARDLRQVHVRFKAILTAGWTGRNWPQSALDRWRRPLAEVASFPKADDSSSPEADAQRTTNQPQPTMARAAGRQAKDSASG